MSEKRELFGKTVEIQIPSDVFPSAEKIKALDEVTGQNCQHGWYEGSSAGEPVNLHYRYWLPQNNKAPKGVVVFTMGIQSETSHGLVLDGRTLDISLVVETFMAKGFALYAKDQYGHGLSEGKRFYIPSYEEMRDDCVGFANLVAGKHSSDIPLFLMGESFGGCQTLLTAKYFQDHPEEAPKNFDSSLLVCPAIVGDVPPYPVYLFLRYVLARLFPTKTYLMPASVSPERIWSDRTVMELYNNPEHLKMGLGCAGATLQLGTAVAMLLGMEDVKSSIPEFKTPFCIVHGENDVAVPIVGSKLLFDDSATPSGEKEFHPLSETLHGVLAEPKAEEAMKHMSDFCDSRLKAFVPPK